MTDVLYRDEVYKIVGALMEVHSVLGPGFYEAVYQEACEIELRLRGIPFEPQKRLTIWYKGVELGKYYIADLACFERIVVELKALDQLTTRDEARLLNDLKATGCELGILANSGTTGRLEWKRFVRTQSS